MCVGFGFIDTTEVPTQDDYHKFFKFILVEKKIHFVGRIGSFTYLIMVYLCIIFRLHFYNAMSI